MNFTRRHERELVEIKALNQELRQRVTVAMDQIKRIQKAHGIKPAQSTVDEHDAETLLAFVHIPKTAGGTVTSMFHAAYSKTLEDPRTAVRPVGNYLRYPEATVRKVRDRRGALDKGGRVMIGHVPYGLFREHLPAGTRYMTFLREPVDRVLSHYYRHIHINRAPRRGRVRKSLGRSEKLRRVKADSLEEALVELRLPDLNNLATRFLCGDPAPGGELPPSALEEAKANLREFEFVGIQERFEESIVLLARMLGQDLVASADRHVSSDRPAVEEISDDQRALVEEHNALDAELYRLGQELFEDAVASADEELAADVQTLRRLSAAANEEYRTALQDARDWLGRELPADTTKPEASVHAAAAAAGISDLLLKRASRALAVRRVFQDGHWALRRPPEMSPLRYH